MVSTSKSFNRAAEFGDRQFVSTSASVSDSTASIRIVQYNVLAESQCVVADYCNKLTGVSEEDVIWSSRFPRLIRELKQYDPDVIVLEEVEREAFARDFVPQLAAMGYTDSMYANRDSEVAVGEFPAFRKADGVAMFCRPAVLKMVATRRVLYSEEVDRLLPEAAEGELRSRLDASEHSGDSIRHEGQSLPFNTNGKGVALLALLKHEASKKFLVIAGTHFYHAFTRNYVKSAQALMLTRAIDLFAKAEAPSVVPVVICGDFNSHPQDGHFWHFDQDGKKKLVGPEPGGAYRLFRTGKLEQSHKEHPHKVGAANMPADLHSPLTPLVSAYSTMDGGEPEITSRDAHFASCLDFVWLGSTQGAADASIANESIGEPEAKLQKVESVAGLAVQAPVATQLLEIPYARGEGAQFPAMPNAEWPSDHLALGVVIAF